MEEKLSLVQQIEVTQQKYLQEKISGGRWSNLRASGIDDICNRRLFYYMTAGEMATPFSIETQAKFEEGKEQEIITRRLLSELGIEISKPTFVERWSGISVLPDGVISNNGDRFLIEIKSVNDNYWDKLQTKEDFLTDKFAKKWYGQLQIGMVLLNFEKGLFILKKKTAKLIRPIEIALDYAYAETLLKKAELVNKAIKDNIPPDFLANNPAECKACPFFAKVCNPPMDYGDTIVDIQDTEIEDMLKRRAEIEPLAKEFKKLDEETKGRFRDLKEAFCGNFHITVKDRKMTQYEVPEEIKNQYKIEGIAKIVIIEPIKTNKD